MTYYQAVQLMYSNGHVGRSIEDLMKNRPTLSQLDAAVDSMIVLEGISKTKANEAKEVIMKHWKL